MGWTKTAMTPLMTRWRHGKQSRHGQKAGQTGYSRVYSILQTHLALDVKTGNYNIYIFY